MNISANTKVSVIICFFNAPHYLEEAIESVLHQNYEHFELLLIDDGSSDNSTAIALQYKSSYPGKVFYYEHDGHVNKGLSASRNVGIAKAEGELIAFLDADDVWLTGYLSNQVKILKTHDVSMVCEATEYWFSWQNYKVDDVVIPVGANQNFIFSPPQLMLNLYPLGAGDAPCMCGIVIKRNVIIKYQGFDESFTGMYEDQVFLTKIYLNEPIYISSKCNNRYRQRHDSMLGSSHYNGEYYIVRKRYLDWLGNYLKDKKINLPSVDDLLEKALQPLPCVSIVIAFLNEEKFLGEAIESVLQQDYPNWELILVDDGSADGSIELAKGYAERYAEKIFYYEHDGHANKGLSASRNAGIKLAKGKYIAFLDADDVWLNRKLSEQVSIFKKFPNLAMVAEASNYWYTWTTSIKRNKIIPIGVCQDKLYQPTELLFLLYPLGIGAAPCPSGLMLTKEAMHTSGGFEESFTNKLQLYEDQAFLFKIYLNYEVYISSACNNLYRQREGSIVQKVKADGYYHTVRKDFLNWAASYLHSHTIENEKLNKCLANALYPYHHPYLYGAFKIFPQKIKRLSKKIINRTASRLIKKN